MVQAELPPLAKRSHLLGRFAPGKRFDGPGVGGYASERHRYLFSVRTIQIQWRFDLRAPRGSE